MGTRLQKQKKYPLNCKAEERGEVESSPMAGSNGVGSENASSSDDGHSIAALMKLFKKEIEVMVICTIEKQMLPIVENLVSRIVKEEIQSAQEKNLASGDWYHTNIVAASKGRSLHLKFLDEVSDPVLTGKAIKGKGGTSLTVALVDKITGHVVKTGPESSAKVEILLLKASDGGNEHDRGLEDFNNWIIREGDKEKPHLKSNYIYLKKGIGELTDAKLAHGSKWMKNCKCHLGARVVENLNGMKVQGAWTNPFMVSDRRNNFCGNHYPPSLSDPVWRLEKIGKGGDRCKRLNGDNILTVQEFLFWQSVDPEKLRKIMIPDEGTNDISNWKATVNHARTCIIDDKRIFVYRPPSNHENGVVLNVVGGLKGIIRGSHCVMSDHLSEDDKDLAHNLLHSAFENRKRLTPFSDEAALQLQYPYLESYAATTASVQEGQHGNEHTVSTSNNHCDSKEPGTSSQSIIPAIGPSRNLNDTFNSGSLAPTTLQQKDYSLPDVPNFSPRWDDDLESFLGQFGDNGNLKSLCSTEGTNLSTALNESQSRQLQYPYLEGYATTTTSIQEGQHDNEHTIFVSNNHCDSNEPGTSSQSILPTIGPSRNMNDTFNSGTPAPTTLQQQDYSWLDVPNFSPSWDADLDSFLEQFRDNGNPRSLFCAEGTNLSVALNESQSHRLQYPYLESYAATTTTIQEGQHGNEHTISADNSHGDSNEPGTSSQSIIPAIGPSRNLNDTFNSGSLAPKTLQQQDNSWPYVPNFSPSCHSDLDSFLESFRDNENQRSLFSAEGNNFSTVLNESQSRQQSNVHGILFAKGVVADIKSMFQARKRRVLDLGQGDVHVSKRQRIEGV